jgi:3-hydroxyacyl-CoA dehydrogenase
VSGELQIDRVAVIGAGVMGAQIAAVLANAGLEVDLLDLSTDDEPAGHARQGLTRALNARPPAFYIPELAERVTPLGLDDLEPLGAADWVIEAIVEQFELKQALLERIEAATSSTAIISTNTSGLSISGLVAARSTEFAARFLGTHFFNPPRYMRLVEVVPGRETRNDLPGKMAAFLTDVLGKEVVFARDTPNFIANRLGIFAIMDVLHRMAESRLSVELVDALTGPVLGRPKSATLRLCDVIGLDTLAHVAHTGYVNLPHDAMRDRFLVSPSLQRMLDAGLLGSKAGGGFYRKVDSRIQAIDLETLEYRDLQSPELGDLDEVLETRDLGDRLHLLWGRDDSLSGFARDHLIDVLEYAANNAEEMAADVSQIDRAMKWGFNWEAGPFELWDLIGADLVSDKREAPSLLGAAQRVTGGQFYAAAGVDQQALQTTGGSLVSIAAQSTPLAGAQVLNENDGACLLDLGDGLGVLQFRGKMNAIGPDALVMAYEAASGHGFKALVICGAGQLFSVGANLKLIGDLSEAGDWTVLEEYVRDFQNSIRGLQRAPFQVVAAPRGFALGGGCEFCLGADVRIAAAELRMGFVETRVGLIPGGGGCMEMVRRFGADIEPGFQLIFRGQFSDNAYEAQQRGLLGAQDRITLREDALPAAIAWARERAAADYLPPEAASLCVAGASEAERLENWLQEQERTEQITTHDLTVGRSVVRVLCGGDSHGSRLTEQELLDLEREEFLKLCGHEETRQRIAHMLSTGKPLRN